MELCREQKLRLSFQEGYCRVRPLETNAPDWIDVPLSKSVFRAVLARVAALCNERVPNSVTPYRGAAEFTVGSISPATFHVSFINIPTEQRLDVMYLGECHADATNFTVLLNDKRVVTIRGHALKYLSDTSNPTDPGSYGILSRVDGEDVFVALFQVKEVIGIFNGEMRESQEAAPLAQ